VHIRRLSTPAAIGGGSFRSRSLHTARLLSCIFRKRLHKVANHHLPLGPERMENRGHIRLVTGEMRAYGDIYTDILQIIANFSLFSL
jgi:hypothetical protein